MPKLTRGKKTLTMALRPLSGDAVEPVDFLRAMQAIEVLLSRGAASGITILNVPYTASGNPEIASYEVWWNIQ